MGVFEIVLYPDPRLREVCTPVERVDSEVREVLQRMAETMYAAPGVGLAGPQVGYMSQVIVVDPGVGTAEDEQPASILYKLVNPVIVERVGERESDEACLSIPGINEKISRAESVVVEALNENGEDVRIEAEDFLAVVLQHEIDHLNGVLFIDHLSRLKREIVKSKLKKMTQ